MTQYIPKFALVAEIEKKRNETDDSSPYLCGMKYAYKNVLEFINSLEVKEVEEEPESVWHDANQQPAMYRKYLVRYSDGRVSGSWERHDDGFIPWKDVVKEHSFTHWCYVEDLLKL